MTEHDTDTCPVDDCGRPTGDGFVCRKCLGDLRRLLERTPEMVGELETAIAKLSRFVTEGGRVRGSGVNGADGRANPIAAKSTPLLFNVQASDVRQRHRDAFAEWTRDLADVLNDERYLRGPARQYPALASFWMLGHLEAVRTWPEAPDMIDALKSAHAAVVWTIDRPAERRYLGECGAEQLDEDGNLVETCTATLWGRSGEDMAKCRECGTKWLQVPRLEKVQAAALEGLEDRIMTATQAAETIVAYGIGDETNAARVRDRIRKWGASPLLTARMDLPTPGQRKRPGYRFGDVLELVKRTDEHRRAKQRKPRAS